MDVTPANKYIILGIVTPANICCIWLLTIKIKFYKIPYLVI